MVFEQLRNKCCVLPATFPSLSTPPPITPVSTPIRICKVCSFVEDQSASKHSPEQFVQDISVLLDQSKWFQGKVQRGRCLTISRKCLTACWLAKNARPIWPTLKCRHVLKYWAPYMTSKNGTIAIYQDGRLFRVWSAHFGHFSTPLPFVSYA